MDKVYIISGLLSFLSFPLIAQNSDYQAQYREKVLEYNQDLKAAGYNEAMKQEMIKSARADFKPKLSAGGNFNYTGNPLELSIDLPSMNSPLYFQGKDLKYGATLSLSQPIYTGGGIRANYQKARQEKELASNESDRIKSNTLLLECGSPARAGFRGTGISYIYTATSGCRTPPGRSRIHRSKRSSYGGGKAKRCRFPVIANS